MRGDMEKYENCVGPNPVAPAADLPKRRALKPSVALATAADLQEVNESEERANRNLNRIMEQATKFTSPKCTPERRKSIVSNAGMTNVQIAEHYSNCLKLSAENKINLKNAFDLHLIDLMASMLNKEEANFQTASSTLDAGAKIYAYRVDNLYKETYKIYGGLGRSDKVPLNDDDLADNDDELEAREAAAKEKSLLQSPVPKKKRKKIVKGSCIETNEKALNAASNDAKYQTDELFESVRASFEEGNTSGLFLNTLATLNDFGRLVLHSYCSLSHETFNEMIPINFDAFKSILKQAEPTFKSGSTCPAVASFDFSNWTISTDSKQLDDSPLLGRKMLESTTQKGKLDADNFFGASPGPFHNFSAGPSFSDSNSPRDAAILNDSIHFDDDQKETKGTSVLDKKFETLEAALSTKDLEYSYFDPNVLQTFLGPDHWKLKRPAGSAKPLNDPESQLSPTKSKIKPSARSVKKKKPTVNERVDLNKNVDFNKLLKTNSRTSSMISDQTLNKLKNVDLTIDPISDDLPLSLYKLFLKPDVEARPRVQSPDRALDDAAIGDFNVDRAADVANFCPDSQPSPSSAKRDDEDDMIAYGDVPDDDDDIAAVGPSTSAVENGGGVVGDAVAMDATITDDNMVEQPYKINKIDINYAKHAKRIDVKKLKSAMWKIITGDERREDTPMHLRHTSPQVIHTSFATLCDKLTAHLSSQTMQNLSVHTTFTVLLHMCNERNLELKGAKDFDQIVVYQR